MDLDALDSFGYCPVAGFCERGNEHLGSICGGEFTDQFKVSVSLTVVNAVGSKSD